MKLPDDKTFRKGALVVFAFIAVIWLIIGSYYHEKGFEKYMDYHFDGIVDSVSYDIKGDASVIVKGGHFFLGGPFWNFDQVIQKGDTIRKDRNSMKIKLIKPGGKVILQDGE